MNARPWITQRSRVRRTSIHLRLVVARRRMELCRNTPLGRSVEMKPKSDGGFLVVIRSGRADRGIYATGSEAKLLRITLRRLHCPCRWLLRSVMHQGSDDASRTRPRAPVEHRTHTRPALLSPRLAAPLCTTLFSYFPRTVSPTPSSRLFPFDAEPSSVAHRSTRSLARSRTPVSLSESLV